MRHVNTKQDFYAMSRKLMLGNILRQWTWDEFKEQFLNDRYSVIHGGTAVLPKICGVRHVRQAFTNKGNSGLLPVAAALAYGLRTADRHNLLFDEGAIHDRLTIQGEVMADEHGLYVRYSHLQCHQRTLWHISANGLTGLKRYQWPHNLAEYRSMVRHGQPVVLHARGLKASALLQKYMDADAWDMLNDIMSCQHESWDYKHRLACGRSMRFGNTVGDRSLNLTYPIVEFACFDRRVGVLGWNTLFWEVRTRY